MTLNGSIFHLVLTTAREAGFVTAGIASVPEPGSADDLAERRQFESWIERGRAGEMEYLKRRDDAGRLLRSSLRIAMPWSRSVIVCVANYNSAAPRSLDPAPKDTGWIARYAWSGQSQTDGTLRPSDYHKVLLDRLRNVEQQLHGQLGGFESRCYVDTGPVVERVYAKYAGVGWVGKNTCILNQEQGSWLFLGVIVTSLELPEEDRPLPAADRCGSCRRCIEACPTGALTPYQMDASLCIAYLTIEKRGQIPLELREQVGRQIFGCDICQEVCPWNRKAPAGNDAGLAPRIELVNPALDWLADLDAAAFGRLFYGSPVKRTRLEGLRRNLAISMGNSRLAKFLPKLRQWAQSEDSVLADAAAWAIDRLSRDQPANE